jgi:thymidylate synthase (FAD)
MDRIKVLDRGYVRLVEHMGDDLSPVNDAKTSFMKESAEYGPSEQRLMAFLLREPETSPFRHSFLKFEVYAPLVVARQWWKYAISSNFGEYTTAWNESSRRYVTEEPEFYIPESWRGKPENKKQGSGLPVDTVVAGWATSKLAELCHTGEELYREAMEMGICPEQARLFLPAYGMYVRFRWSASLQSVCWFLSQRLAHKAQVEIQAYAEAILALSRPYFPEAIKLVNSLAHKEVI